MTTVKPRGARTVAPISHHIPHAAPQAPRVAPPVSDDDRIELLARRVIDGHPLSDAAREWLRGRGSREDAPAGLAADLGLAGFASMRDLGQAALEADASRREIVETALRLARWQSRLDAASRPVFLDKMRRLRGPLPQALADALDLASTAHWGLVAERLETIRLSPRAGVR